jgi:cardiolipin synthase
MMKVVKFIPNVLTVIRFITVPFMIIFMAKDNLHGAMWIFLFAEFTDVADGFLARKLNVSSKFGIIADPIADKMVHLGALLMLADKNLIYKIIPLLLLCKELFLVMSGVFLYKKKIDLSAKWFGKVSSFLMFIIIMLVFLGVRRSITDVLCWMAISFAIFASMMYAFNYLTSRNRGLKSNS